MTFTFCGFGDCKSEKQETIIKIGVFLSKQPKNGIAIVMIVVYSMTTLQITLLLFVLIDFVLFCRG